MQVLAGVDVADPPLAPVAAGRLQAVSEQPGVLADRRAGQRHRAVRRERVRIEQHARLRLAVERRGPVEDVLVLQPVVLCVEVAAALLVRHAVLLVVPQRGQPVADRAALRDGLEERERHLVLGLDPGARLGRVRILEPAVRVRHLGAVVGIDHGALGSGRIGEPAGRNVVPGGLGALILLAGHGLASLRPAAAACGRRREREGRTDQNRVTHRFGW